MLPFIRYIAIASAISLVACGGGNNNGKSSSKKSSSISSSSSLAQSSLSSTSSSVATVAVKINGTINGFSLSGEDTPLDLDKLDIQIELLDSSNTSVTSNTPIASSHINSTELRFTGDITGNAGTFVAITVSYPGYTSYSRKLNADAHINFDAKLQEVPELNITQAISESISGVSIDGYSIQVNAAGDELQSDSMSIQIPASLLPENTESLDVAVRTFDPNSPDDAEFFPGAYEDSDGNPLASVAFNFAEIKTNTGEGISAAMQKARQQKISKGGSQKLLAEEPIVINRQIPAQSCALLETIGDSAPELDGFQVPVYTYNPTTGLWDLLGQGTLYTESGEKVSSSQTEFNCSTNTYYLEIWVTDDIFLSNWWNLDYPLTFTQPIAYCAQIQVKNTDSVALPNVSGFAMDNDNAIDFASSIFTTDQDGKALIKVMQSSINPDLTAKVLFFNDDTFGYIQQEIALSTNCDSPAVQVIELTKPKMCDITGHIQYEESVPAVRSLVYAFSDENSPVFGFDFATTNEAGNYRLSIPCNGHYDVISYASLLNQSDVTQKTSPDGNIDPDELTDNGNLVVMKTLDVDYARPIIFGSYDDSTNQLTLFGYSTFDAFPMTASITIKSANGLETYATFNTSFTESANGNDDEFMYFFVGQSLRNIELPASANGYQITATVTDALNKTWEGVTGYIGIMSEE